MAVLVLSGNDYKTVSIVRSLGKKGIDVDVVGNTKYAMSFYSKYCRNKYVISSKDRKEWFKQLLNILKKEKYELLIPQSEGDCIFLAKNRNKLPYNCLLLPPTKSLEIAANKEMTMKLAEKLGVPTPKTWYINDLSQLEKINLTFPVVIKARFGGIRPVYVFDEKSFIKKYLDVHKITRFPIIQEVIIGDGYGTFALCKNGKVLQYFAHKRIKEQDPKGSGSSRCESFSLTKDLKKYTDIIVKKLKWTGVIMLEFKYDNRTKKFRLIEINGRFWGSLPLAIHSGVNFPYQLYRLAIGKPIHEVKKWKKTCAKYLLGELIRFARIAKGKPKDWKLYFPTLSEGLKDLIFHERKCKYFVLDFSDPFPFFMDFIDRFYRYKSEKRTFNNKKENPIPILMYHNIYDKKKDKDFRSISFKKFEKHLRYLKKNSYKTATLSEKIENSNRIVYLTFDDGYESHYKAFKLLLKYGFKGTFFIVTDMIGKPGYLNEVQIKEMSSNGMEIGSHSKTHANLIEISGKERIYELIKSKKKLEKIIDKKVKSISIPGGTYNLSVIRDCFKCKYKKVRTSDPDWLQNINCSVFPAITITRFPILGNLKFLLSNKGLKIFQFLKIIKKSYKNCDNYKIKGLFHVHSNYSNDGKLSLKKIRELSIKNGYSFVFLSDHAEDFDKNKWKKYIKECKNLSDNKFVFIPGLEISSADGPHILFIGNKKYFRSKIAKKVIEYAEKNRIMWGIAHIRRNDWEILDNIKDVPLFIEVWNSKYHGFSASLENLVRFKRIYRNSFNSHIFSIAGNDIHSWKKNIISVYIPYIEKLNEKNIIDKIKNGNFVCCFKESMLMPDGNFQTSLYRFLKYYTFRKIKSNKVIRKIYHLVF